MKIITVCGSRKFKIEMTQAALELELNGNVVLMPIFLPDGDVHYDENEVDILGKMHKEKIKISDAIFVADINGYIGESTKSEIELAKSLNKEIIYYSDIMQGDKDD